MGQENSPLTDEARIAIIRYMVSLVAIPGVLIAIIGFLIGFFLEKAATSSAYEKAYTAVQEDIFDLFGSVSNAAASRLLKKSLVRF